MFVRGCRVALACALSALVLAACSSGDKPVALPSLSPSSSPSASPSPTDSATELAAVSAVVRRYFALINGPTSTGAAKQLFGIMTAACTCRRAARSMRDAAASHETFFGNAQVTSLIPNLDGSSSSDVLVHYDFSRGGLRDSGGRVLRSAGARRNVSLDFRLLKVAGTWLISDVQIVSNGSPA